MPSRRRLAQLIAGFAWLAAVAWPGVIPGAAFAAAASKEALTTSCHSTISNAASMARLATLMAQGRFVSYQPTSLQTFNGRSTHADPAGIRADLRSLRSRFDGLITYTAIHGAQGISGIAAQLGFRGVIIGVWDPFDPAEMAAALRAAAEHPQVVLGLSLGSESVFAKRRSFAQLAAAAAAAHRAAPQLVISATEPFHMYYEPASAPLLAQLDVLLANVHPVFQPWFAQALEKDAAQFVVNVVDRLAQHYCGPILVRETGEPTGPAGSSFSEQRQALFYQQLQLLFPPQRSRAFAYFSAFDAPWREFDSLPLTIARPHPEEAHWGLFDDKRSPKEVVRRIAPLP